MAKNKVIEGMHHHFCSFSLKKYFILPSSLACLPVIIPSIFDSKTHKLSLKSDFSLLNLLSFCLRLTYLVTFMSKTVKQIMAKLHTF